MLELRAAFLQQHGSESDRGDADRDVDEEDPRPVQVRGQDAAEQDADRCAATRGGAVDPEREIPLAALCKRGHQERERGGREQRAPEALHCAERDQRGLRPREPAEERADREEREPCDEDPPTPEQVGDPAAE